MARATGTKAHVAVAVLSGLLVAVGCGGEQQEANVPPLGDEEARGALLTELLLPPEQRSGTLRFAVRSVEGQATTLSVRGVADHDRQRYVSRMEVTRPDVEAAYDVAVIDGLRYEKLLRIRSAAGSAAFEPQWSSPDPWAPSTSLPSLPYVPVPFVGEPGWDIRRGAGNVDEARRREVLDAMLTGFSRMGADRHRGAPAVHYRLTFDREKAKTLLAAEVARGLVVIPPAGPGSRDVDAWIDHQGRLVRYVWPVSDASRLEYEFWDHGKPSAVEVPDGLEVRPR